MEALDVKRESCTKEFFSEVTNAALPFPLSLDPRSKLVRSAVMEVRGLSKHEAEKVLDELEACGSHHCELSFVAGRGFSVRAEVQLNAEG